MVSRLDSWIPGMYNQLVKPIQTIQTYMDILIRCAKAYHAFRQACNWYTVEQEWLDRTCYGNMVHYYTVHILRTEIERTSKDSDLLHNKPQLWNDEKQLYAVASQVDQIVKSAFIEVFTCVDQLFKGDIRKALSCLPEVSSRLGTDLDVYLDCERPSDLSDLKKYGLSLYNTLLNKYPHLTAMRAISNYVDEAFPLLEKAGFYNKGNITAPYLVVNVVSKKVSDIFDEVSNEYSNKKQKMPQTNFTAVPSGTEIEKVLNGKNSHPSSLSEELLSSLEIFTGIQDERVLNEENSHSGRFSEELISYPEISADTEDERMLNGENSHSNSFLDELVSCLDNNHQNSEQNTTDGSFVKITQSSFHTKTGISVNLIYSNETNS